MKTCLHILFSLVLAAACARAQFTKITDLSNPVVDDQYESGGGTWVDVNGDGYLDLFVSNGNLTNQNNSFYLNDRNGGFVKVTTGAVVTDGGSSIGSTWGDFDNDGKIDFFVTNRDNFGNFLYRGLGDTLFSKIVSGSPVEDIAHSNSSSWVDIDRDGDLDLYVINFQGNDFYYRNSGAPSFELTRVDSLPQSSDGGAFSISGSWTDYDNDLMPDFFVGNAGGENDNLWHNDGGILFSKTILADGKNSIGNSWGDYDNDGAPDLVVTNTLGQNNVLYHNSGAPGYALSPVAATLSVDGGNSVGSAWGDYDNDGDLDLFIANDGTNNFLYQNDGPPSYTFTKVLVGSPVTDGGNSFGAVWGDYDRDGYPDLFVANRLNQRNFLYHNTGSGNHWLHFRCTGTLSSRTAIGSKVRVKAVINGSPRWQYREVRSQTGYNSENLVVMFGLGDASVADSVVIEWPSGMTEYFTNVQADRLLTVVEGDSTPVALVSPADGLINPLPVITLRWMRDLYGPPYRLQVSTDSTFAGGFVLDDSVVTDTSAVLPVASDSSTYYWRVRPATGIHDQAWSEVRSFTNLILPPALLFPPDGGLFPSSVTLRWSALDGGSSYDAQVSVDSLFGSLFAQGDTLTDTTLFVDSLTLHATYYWRVRARNPMTTGGWSAARSFTADTLTVGVGVTAQWNLISVPVGAPGLSFDSIFPGATAGAFGFDPESGYYDSPLLENLRGYWVKFGSPQAMTYSGSSTPDAIALKEGWNMVGTTSDPVAFADIVSQPPGIIASPAYGYSLGYAPTDTLFPGKGYWIKLSDQGTLTLSPPQPGIAPAAARGAGAQELPGDLGTLVVRDAGGNERTLYFGGSHVEKMVDWWELPPPPPAGVFDARYATGSAVAFGREDAESGVPLLISAAYPVSVSWNAPAGVAALLSVDGRSVTLAGTGTVEISDAAARIVLEFAPNGSAGDIPERFSLGQNYPNPFNPSTTIGFTLGRAGFAQLKVYDMLGRIVATVFSGTLSRGDHALQFDGGSLSGGVYYYVLEAEGTRTSRKMVLSK